MTPSTVVLLLTSAAVALAVLPITHSSSLDIAEPDLGNTALLADDWSTIETAIDDELEGLDIECDTFDGLDTDDGTNSTLGPSPGMMRIAYGTQWKKGLLQWVAFPQMGLLSCKKTAILGRKMVGKKYSACQSSFKFFGKWYQLDGCNPTTGMPQYLLDEEGYTIQTCKPKKFKVLCMVEGMIQGRGSCEDPPPEPERLSVGNTVT